MGNSKVIGMSQMLHHAAGGVPSVAIGGILILFVGMLLGWESIKAVGILILIVGTLLWAFSRM
jgi:hypothetical protein